MRKILLTCVWMLCGLLFSPLFAGDAESAALAVKAAEQAKNGDWRDAAKTYEEAEFEAADPQLRLIHSPVPLKRGAMPECFTRNTKPLKRF